MDNKKTAAEYAAEIERVRGYKLHSLKQIARLTNNALNHDMTDIEIEQLIKVVQVNMDELRDLREEIFKLSWNCLVDNDDSFKFDKID